MIWLWQPASRHLSRRLVPRAGGRSAVAHALPLVAGVQRRQPEITVPALNLWSADDSIVLPEQRTASHCAGMLCMAATWR